MPLREETGPMPISLCRRRTLLASAGALPFLPRPSWAAAPAIGAPAPAFSLPDQDGATRSLADYRGKVVVLEWTNHECPFVQKHYGSGNMQRFQREAAERGIAWLSVASSPPGQQGHVTAAEAHALTAEREAAPAAVLLDPRAAPPAPMPPPPRRIST
jgi:hypothetical protein